MRNALTVDVEDWFQVSNFERHVSRDDWDSYPSRVESNTQRLLDLFDEFSVKGTFFVLGWIARKFPGLVREIAERGHEVASHGDEHRLVYDLGADAFGRDLDVSRDAIQAAAGVRVRGFRAPSFSIDRRSLWAFDVLVERDFEFDSSVFPVHHPRYGIPDFVRVPRRVRTPGGSIIREFPMTTLRFLNHNFGASGGGYMRLFPLQLLEAAFGRMNRSGQPAVLYLHPWEVDPGQPRIPVRGLGRITHYRNLHQTESRLRRLLAKFRFAPMSAVLDEAPGLAAEPVGVS